MCVCVFGGTARFGAGEVSYWELSESISGFRLFRICPVASSAGHRVVGETASWGTVEVTLGQN